MFYCPREQVKGWEVYLMASRIGWSRGGLAAAASLLGVVLLSTVPAFACTQVMGSLTITPAYGHAGSTVTTSAKGLKPYPAKYAIHFGNTSSDSCMSSTGVTILKTIATNRTGQWTNVPVVIPPASQLGTHEMCGLEKSPQPGGTGTTHDTFTVT